MESIYIKKFTKQDITKSYSPSTDATRDFFCVDLNMTQDYIGIDVCYYGHTEYPPGITIHKGYQGVKDWRICGNNFKSLYTFRNPEEGDLSVWKRVGKNGNYKFSIQVVKPNEPEYEDYIKLFANNDNHLFINVEDDDSDNVIPNTKNNTVYTSPIQKIFYGVPGCGKSHKISEMLEDKNIFDIKSEENQIVRTVFHPDYTNADFVGQILPEVNESKIEYNFKAGPFTKILAKALIDPENQYVLIIEEINRGNSAAIFGEIIQLLDRLEGEKTSTIGGNKYGKGWSEYFFMNDLINEYVRKIASRSDNVETSVQINGIIFTANTGIRLPPNLSLFATMNTSDQNVFTLDNAFQRRWDMEYISNRYNEVTANEKQKAQYNSKIGETAISWGKFRDAINKEISNPENTFGNAEDKQLGLFFIKAENNVIKESDFSNKVLKYLWNDIFKRNKSIFNHDVSTFGDLLEAFSGADAFTNSFSSDFVSKIAE